ncbi:MAG TPA: NUDIX hydrolase [Solirubrobacterales bacterium]|nr:NUDIX hydrolase [Solirubrobacterales bacterium]
MTFLEADRYAEIQREVPIACVDLLCAFPERAAAGEPDLLLIERRDAEDRSGMLNLVGGRIHHGESLEEAAMRHLHETLGDGVIAEPRDWGRPEWVAVYPHRDAGPGPYDPRQHSVSPSYLLRCSGVPRVEAGGEAEGLHFFAAADPPPGDRFGFGQGDVVARLLEAL